MLRLVDVCQGPHGDPEDLNISIYSNGVFAYSSLFYDMSTTHRTQSPSFIWSNAPLMLANFWR